MGGAVRRLGRWRSRAALLLAPPGRARSSASSSRRARSRRRTRSSRGSRTARSATRGEAGLRRALPRLPQGRRRADRAEEGRPPGREGRLRVLPRRARRAGRRAPSVRHEAKFDHAKETGFPLDGQHAASRGKCASCHKTRSFLKLSPSCASCHADVHKGALGADCATCHSTAVAFKETREVVRPREDAVPADRGARDGGLREVPRERRLPRREVRDLRRLPQEPAPAGVRRGLLLVPRDGDVPDRRRSTTPRTAFPLTGTARRGPVRRLPQASPRRR